MKYAYIEVYIADYTRTLMRLNQDNLNTSIEHTIQYPDHHMD